jgi:hypothetical protein
VEGIEIYCSSNGIMQSKLILSSLKVHIPDVESIQEVILDQDLLSNGTVLDANRDEWM